jgi:hypothetical protein
MSLLDAEEQTELSWYYNIQSYRYAISCGDCCV